MRNRLEDAEALINELPEENEAAIVTHQSLAHEMCNALEAKDVTFSELKGKLSLNILD